jgi:hypothetical protein
MSSTPKPALEQIRRDPAATDTGLFRCSECGTLFSSEDELREHEAAYGHPENSDQQEMDGAANEGMIGDYDQLDGTKYPDSRRH